MSERVGALGGALTRKRRNGRRAANRVAADARGGRVAERQSVARLIGMRGRKGLHVAGRMKLKNCIMCLIHSTSVTSATVPSA
jgi:hypothetical protein